MAAQKWFFRDKELAHSEWDVHVDPLNPPTEGWQYTGLRVATLKNTITIAPDSLERVLFPLDGPGLSISYTTSDGISATQSLRGRASVFHGPADFLYLPRDTQLTISGSGRIAIGEAPAKNSKAPSFTPKEKVQVLLRGAGKESRQVHNYGMPDTLDADRLVVCEVIVPSGNWSGAPAHKHDCYIPGKESNLEEIYYFEVAVSRSTSHPAQSSPFGYFRGFSADDRPYDVTEEVRCGDVALVPYGWHGPTAAGPGYDLYFFNVMAGPDPDRSWNATDHPDQAWIRETWNSQPTDPRLPYGE